MPWLAVAVAGGIAPAAAMILLADAPASQRWTDGPILAVGLMGAGMISAAATGRLWVGCLLALAVGAGLVLLAQMLGMPTPLHLPSLGLAMAIAVFSFAARGALFARSAAARGWWIAVFVVGGEAAMLLTASVRPGTFPDWLLVLLPAQWASMAIQTALTGPGTLAAGSALLALAGTGATTLFVARLWPRRWPYAVMFSAWLGFSALVWHFPVPSMPRVDPGIAASPAGKSLLSGPAFLLDNHRVNPM
jgi:hypothetical protein